jgi:hypothetical protein
VAAEASGSEEGIKGADFVMASGAASTAAAWLSIGGVLLSSRLIVIVMLNAYVWFLVAE